MVTCRSGPASAIHTTINETWPYVYFNNFHFIFNNFHFSVASENNIFVTLGYNRCNNASLRMMLTKTDDQARRIKENTQKLLYSLNKLFLLSINEQINKQGRKSNHTANFRFL